MIEFLEPTEPERDPDDPEDSDYDTDAVEDPASSDPSDLADREPTGEGDPAALAHGDPTAPVAAASEPPQPNEHFRDAAKRAIEAIVLVSEEPMPPHLLAQLLEVSPVVVDALCRELAESYETEGRGFELVRVAGGWRYQSHPDQAAYVERLVMEGQTAKLSAAALETLAIVAYKQPISRAQVASIRGVSVDGVMRTLQQRGFIAEVGKDPGPGQALMFGTTRSFLEKLGLDGLDDLPPLGDFVPSAYVVEQLERGLRPDRQALSPEDVMAAPDPDDIAPDPLDDDEDE